MASGKSEDPMNNSAGMGSDAESRRKRLRRVSFADREITSVHIFNRDEDYETPPVKPQDGDASESEDKVIRFFGELSDREDTEGDCDGEDEPILDKTFLRPNYSPSSGGSTVGSATGDEEDNFFGPVSSHFINPGRLSDTAISEEHDITMDSTAFSMHFRSLARSESGDVRTPSSSHLLVEEKTPTEVTSRSDTGSGMVLLEKPKKLFPKSPLPVEKGSGGTRDSNDMTILGEHSRKYDYGYISPTLAALLGDETNELLPEDNTVEARSPIQDFSLPPQNGCVPLGQANNDSHGIDSSDACQILSPSGSGCHPQMVLQDSGSQHSTKAASLSSSTVRRKSLVSVGTLPQSLTCVTPSPKQRGSLMSRETRALVDSLSIMQKSKSRLELIPASPGSALSQRIEKSKHRLSGYHSLNTPSTIGREEKSVRREKHADIPITNLEDLLSKHDNRTPISEKNGMPDKWSSCALAPVVETSNDNRTPISEKKSMSDCRSGSLRPAVCIRDDNRTPVSEKKGMPSIAIGKSETGDRHATKECADNSYFNSLSDNMDSLHTEPGVLLGESGFLNASAQQEVKDSMNQNRTDMKATQLFPKDNNHFKVLCETEVFSAKDFPPVVRKDLPSTPDVSSMERSKDEDSHAKGSSVLKRKAEDVDCAVRNCSPEVRRSTHHIFDSVMDKPDGNSDANDYHRVREQVINWVEIPGKVTEEIKQMLAPLADALNSKLICKLEDTLTFMKKVHLCEIQSQKVWDDLSGAKTKRRAESRSLLCKLAYEKVKLVLLHLKKEIMRKKFQAVSTDVQISEKLRLNCANFLHQHGFRSTSLLNPDQSHEVIIASKRAEITQEIKELDSKIKNLIQCFSMSVTIIRELAYADAIMTAEDTLQKRMSCRSIRQDVLVWKVDSFGEWNGCQSIVLNYSGIFNQRLTLKPGHPSCVLVSNSLSDAFVKHFPETNVAIAFNSLFNSEESQKYIGSNILLEVTQKTSLLLHNLLDVAEEFHLAQMNIPNLVHGNFDSPSAEQLNLQISFLDCTNMRKLIVILDVACLIHGKYPSDVIPCEVREASGTKRDVLGTKQLKNEIESAMDDVEVGYPRILRLCRCISKVLQSQRRR